MLRLQRRRLRNIIARHPELYTMLYRTFSKNKDFYVSQCTALVIEGFPRSGNSFVEAYIRVTQKDRLLLAHHTHAPAHVLTARAMGIPTIVLFRNPLDCCASLVQHDPSTFNLKLALQEYTIFYHTLISRSDGLLFCDFNIATTQPEEILRRINNKWDLNLEIPSNTEAARRNSFKKLDETSHKRKTIRNESEPYSIYATPLAKQSYTRRRFEITKQFEDVSVLKDINQALDTYEAVKQLRDSHEAP